MRRFSQAIRWPFAQTMASTPKFLKNVVGVEIPFYYIQVISSNESIKIECPIGSPLCVGTVGPEKKSAIGRKHQLEIKTDANGLAIEYPTPLKDHKLVCLIQYHSEHYSLRKIHLCETLEHINQLMERHKNTKAAGICFYFAREESFYKGYPCKKYLALPEFPWYAQI